MEKVVLQVDVLERCVMMHLTVIHPGSPVQIGQERTIETEREGCFQTT